jgi:Fe2+ or Zn2+ uptake regulation protein
MPATAPTPAELDARLIAALRERGQRVTSQRLVIHRVLHELDAHVTAEEVLGAVADKLPGVSLPTVYATLELLAEVGAVRQVPLPSGAAVFDSRVEPHQHVRCRRCGAVQDLEVAVDDGAARAAAERHGYADVDAALVLSGVCAACRRLD